MNHHNYSISKSDFNKVIKQTRMADDTKQALREVLVDGKCYGETTKSKQFIYKKIQRFKEIAEELGIFIG